jgi:hypothetical protein
MSDLPQGSPTDRNGVPLDTASRASLGCDVGLDFEMQAQCHSNWCWAAVAASVSAFFDPDTPFSQCRIASLELHMDCCTVPCGASNVPPEIDVMGTLGSALNRVDCLRAEIPGQATRAQVEHELIAGRPVCVRLVWSLGSLEDGHFVAIVGYDRKTDMLSVADPKYGDAEVPFEQLRTSYQIEKGQWIKTYYTKNSKPA